MVERTLASNRSIGAVAVKLRDLGLRDKEAGLAAEDSGLLARLEDKIGTGRWLQLLAFGNLSDLLQLLPKSSPGFASQLINGLDDALLDDMVERTVARGQSVANFGWALRKQALAAKLGDRRITAVLVSCVPLSMVFDVLQALAEPTLRQAVVRLLFSQTVPAWRVMAMRSASESRFYDLCEVLADWEKLGFAGLDDGNLRQALASMAVECVPQARWYPLESGIARVTKSAVPSWAEPLQVAVAQRVRMLHDAMFDSLPLDDLGSVGNLVWSARPELRAAWASRVIAALADTTADAQLYVRWAPSLVFWLHHRLFDAFEPETLIDNLLQPQRLTAFVEASDGIQTFLYFWNAFLVDYERGGHGELDIAACTLGKRVTPESRGAVLAMIAKATAGRVATKHYARWLPLAGLCELFGWLLPPTPGLRFDLASGKQYPVWGELSQRGFVAAVFLQLGAEVAMGDRLAWADKRVALLRDKYSEIVTGEPDTIVPRAVHALNVWMEARCKLRHRGRSGPQ